MRTRKRDLNQKEIISNFKECGCSVFDTADLGNGFPDLVVGKDGVNLLIEVKATKGILTPYQILFKSLWQGSYYIVRSKRDVLLLINMINSKAIKEMSNEPQKELFN